MLCEEKLKRIGEKRHKHDVSPQQQQQQQQHYETNKQSSTDRRIVSLCVIIDKTEYQYHLLLQNKLERFRVCHCQ